jgi:hypothetical protein
MNPQAAEKNLDVAMIERTRKKAGVSIDAMCREARMSSRSYYYLLSGESSARPETMKRLARAIEAARLAK